METLIAPQPALAYYDALANLPFQAGYIAKDRVQNDRSEWSGDPGRDSGSRA